MYNCEALQEYENFLGIKPQTRKIILIFFLKQFLDVLSWYSIQCWDSFHPHLSRSWCPLALEQSGLLHHLGLWRWKRTKKKKIDVVIQSFPPSSPLPPPHPHPHPHTPCKRTLWDLNKCPLGRGRLLKCRIYFMSLRQQGDLKSGLRQTANASLKVTISHIRKWIDKNFPKYVLWINLIWNNEICM